MDKISVCIATYNGQQFIKKQVESILSQLGADDELIISDDFSTDNTVTILNNFKDKRIKIIFNRGRKGPVGNFEQALNEASGDLIFLADQDDEWFHDKVDVLRTLLQSADLVLSDCQVVDEHDTVLYPSFFTYRNSQPGFWRNLIKNSYMGCCIAFRSTIMAYILPIPAAVHMHDWWIGLLVESKGITYFHPKPLIYYVRHGNNVSPTGETSYGLLQRFYNRLVLLWYITKRLIR